jgi:hypothetical protein
MLSLINIPEHESYVKISNSSCSGKDFETAFLTCAFAALLILRLLNLKLLDSKLEHNAT